MILHLPKVPTRPLPCQGSTIGPRGGLAGAAGAGARLALRDRPVAGMASLRKKVEKDPSMPEHFITGAGIGYRFVV